MSSNRQVVSANQARAAASPTSWHSKAIGSSLESGGLLMTTEQAAPCQCDNWSGEWCTTKHHGNEEKEEEKLEACLPLSLHTHPFYLLPWIVSFWKPAQSSGKKYGKSAGCTEILSSYRIYRDSTSIHYLYRYRLSFLALTSIYGYLN